MQATFIDIGDFHAGPGPRNADRYRSLDHIIDVGERFSYLAAWLWPGDLNHGRMTIEDRNALAGRLQRMAAVAPVVICYGNHDLPGDLDVFARLKAKWPVYVIDRPQTLRILTAAPGTAPIHASIFVLPYPTKAGLVSLGVEHGGIIPTAAQALDTIFMVAAHDLETAAAAGDLTLMIGHVNVAGSLTSVGQPNIGYEIEISEAHLQRFAPSMPKLLNHIHKAQFIGGAYYPGSVCRLNWGEVEPKEFIDVTMFEDGQWGISHHPLDVPPMYHVEGELTRDAFTYHVVGDQAPLDGAAISWKGCEVRVRYRFKASEKSGLDTARVLAEFAEAARLEVEPIAVPDRELRQPEVAAARSLAEKLAVYMHVEQLAPSLAVKLTALEHGDPLVTLSKVQTELSALEQREDVTVAA